MTVAAPENKEIKQMTLALLNWFESQSISATTAGIVMANLIAMDLVLTARSKEDLEKGFNIFGEMVAARVSENWERVRDKRRPKT